MPKVTGPISTTADTDTYPTHDSLEGLGGLREVATHADRNAIPDLRRRAGMLVYVTSDDSYWKLLPSPWADDDSDWVAFSSGSSGYDPITYTLSGVSSWNQSHTFPFYPSVRLIDDLLNSVDVNVEYPDSTHVYIEFPTPFTGTVILS